MDFFGVEATRQELRRSFDQTTLPHSKSYQLIDRTRERERAEQSLEHEFRASFRIFRCFARARNAKTRSLVYPTRARRKPDSRRVRQAAVGW